MTEAEARAALRAFAVGEVEHWIAEQRWEAVPGGGGRGRGERAAGGAGRGLAAVLAAVVGPVTEAEARAALAAFDGLGGLERWIAEQRPWQATPGGWTVPGELQGLRFRVEVAPGGCGWWRPRPAATGRCGSCRGEERAADEWLSDTTSTSI
jgi:hypothetical protein